MSGCHTLEKHATVEFMKLPLLHLATVLGLFSQSDIVISQVYGGGGNTGATLRNDFIELLDRGISPQDLTGWSVQYAPASGLNWQVTPLRGTIAPGRYYLVQEAAGAGGTQSLPTPDAVGDIAMSATAAKVALVRPDGSIAGLVGYGAADQAEGAPTRAPSNTTAILRRGGGCIDTGDNLNDFQVVAPQPRNSASPPVDCLAGPAAIGFLPISQVQGRGSESAFVGQVVETRGIVTARRSNGFYIQSTREDDDGDPTTSEGLFVFTSSAPPNNVARGDLVRVTGTVAEFRPAADPQSLPVTELIDPTTAVESFGHPLPEPVDLSRDLEPLEGMRVRTSRLRSVSATSATLDERNWSSSDSGIFFAVPEGSPRPIRGTSDTEPLRVDTAASEGSQRISTGAGALFEPITGVLDYGARTWTILADPGSAVPQPASGPKPVVAPTTLEFGIANLNLRRFFDTFDDPSTADVALTPDAYDRRLETTARAIRDLLR